MCGNRLTNLGLDEKGKVFVKECTWDDEELILQAAESCPVQAIFLYDDEGNQIYPKVEPA